MAFLRLIALAALVLGILKIDSLKSLSGPASPRAVGDGSYTIDLASALALRSRGAVVVDARDPAAFARGHIAGAVNLAYASREAALARIHHELMHAPGVIVYCGGRDCEISQMTAYFLAERGIPNVAIYRGGFSEWQESGLPVEVSPPVNSPP